MKEGAGPGRVATLLAMSELERRLMVKGFCLSFYVTLVVRFSEFRSVLRLTRNDGATTTHPTRELCELAERAIRRGWSLSPLEGRCLEMALTLMIILRDAGVEAELKLGVDPDLERFAAHAWVEVPECGYVGSFGGEWVPLASLR